MVIEIRAALDFDLGRRRRRNWLQRDMREFLRVNKMLFIFIRIAISEIYIFAKTKHLN